VSTMRFLRSAGVLAGLAPALLGLAPRPAAAQLLSNGPVVVLGFTNKLDQKLVHSNVGWRWELGGGETLTGWAQRASTKLSFVIEPSVGGIFGDESSFETQVVPMLRLEPLGMQDNEWLPYFEGGIGVIYTAIEDLRLGSNFLFSDNLGIGVSWRLSENPRWSRVNLGYRYRHISHAGIFGEPNSGMNTHALTVSFD